LDVDSVSYNLFFLTEELGRWDSLSLWLVLKGLILLEVDSWFGQFDTILALHAVLRGSLLHFLDSLDAAAPGFSRLVTTLKIGLVLNRATVLFLPVNLGVRLRNDSDVRPADAAQVNPL
jgi:hypothetical protein